MKQFYLIHSYVRTKQKMIMVRSFTFFLAKLMLIQFLMAGFASSSTNNFTDQSALLAIKDRITDPRNMLSKNWTSRTSFCNWIGVSCSRNKQRVTALNLAYMGLQGTIAPQVYNLSFLTLLNLRNNSFNGNLLDEVSRLQRLRSLDLGNNEFSGELTRELGNLSKLTNLSLSGNKFNGTIPSSLGNITRLEMLRMEDNQLEGSIPAEIRNLRNLQVLVLRNNKLMGSFPIFNISSLRIIELSDNSFSGNLQEDIGYRLPKLEEIYVGNNQLEGHIPSSLWQCKELQRIYLVNNNFTGSISSDIGNLPKLRSLRLTGNNITGKIPTSLGNISTLYFISMGRNKLEGEIPDELGQLKILEFLNIEINNLTGNLPPSIFNISSLRALSFPFNKLNGVIPSINQPLPNLEILLLSNNRLTGGIPAAISNYSKLTKLDIGSNLLTGSIPVSFRNLKLLQTLLLPGNRLTNEPPNSELQFFTALTECRQLKQLVIGLNPISGFIPNSIGNLSRSLETFLVTGCQFMGRIPTGISNLSNLITLGLQVNDFSGSIPSTIGGLQKLQRLYLSYNELEGSIPSELCSLTQLGELNLNGNKLVGPIPNCIGNLNQLQKLSLSSNALSSTIPINLFNIQNLLLLNLSHNSLIGSLSSDVGKFSNMEQMDISQNQLSDNIPRTMGDLQSLRYLNLSWNSFNGSVPESFGKLIGLEMMDLSKNNLSGVIPNSMEALIHLNHLNLSFNRLRGQVPQGGPFTNISFESFMGNDALCGAPNLQLPACPINSTPKSRSKAHRAVYIVLAIIAPVAIVVVLFFLYLRYREKKRQVPIPVESVDRSPSTIHKMISHQELLEATNNFSQTNLLGVGSSGAVYKGILPEGRIIAIKVLNMQLEGAFKNFDAECQVLRNVRHRNLLSIITACSNFDFKALVFQYMDNRSLETWLYSPNYCLSLVQRINISLDVAFALEYLHHGYSGLEPVIHCDVKPSNVLLDEDMVAHLADFGIAKILAGNNPTAQTNTLGTFGYMAPEYGLEGRVSSCADVYSYGIVLMETFTRKKPTDELFVGEMSLREWVNASVPHAVEEIMDANLLIEAQMEGKEVDLKQENCLSSIMELALECSRESPGERITMKDVVVRLNKIKYELDT